MDTAYSYIKNPKTVQIAKLNAEYRPAFSEIVLFLKRIPFKMQLADAIKEIDKILTNVELREKVKTIVIELHTKAFSKIRLLEPTKVAEKDKAMFHLGSLSGAEVISYVNSNLKTLKSFKWKINVVISNNLLSRVLKPEIWMYFEWEDGGKFEFCTTLEQYQTLRKSIATIILRIHALECIKQINL